MIHSTTAAWSVEQRDDGLYVLALKDHGYLIRYEGRELISITTGEMKGYHVWTWENKRVAEIACKMNNDDLKFEACCRGR